ncbi:TPA: hypothetical protein N0F65_007758 [Lagenidium giganteum]|uniref:Vesicle transport v-SNARE N-terminal domain-containing protein n=1 Tax=Lagenidium giganteum TaxID=4803 RepID=A0AAV2YN84_9STRA|nr:TPA: hypothetical protein N0F65_007758 [Lagenidium giganteum]
MAAKFAGYVEDFESARGDALKAVDAYASCKDKDKRAELHSDATNAIEEVERYVRILENEAKSATSTAEKRKLNGQVGHCKTQLASLKSNLEKAMLVGDSRAKAADRPNDGNKRDRCNLIDSRAMLRRNGRHLNEAQRTLAETEAIATNVTNNLQGQRGALERANMDVQQAQADTAEAKGYLRRLTIKAFTNKICLILVIICLIVAIALVSYYKWYPRNKTDVLHILPTPTPTAVAPSSAAVSTNTSNSSRVLRWL